MGFITTEIGEGLEVQVEYEVTGKNLPATLTDPAEFKEIAVVSVLANGYEIVETLNDDVFEAIREECEVKENS